MGLTANPEVLSWKLYREMPGQRRERVIQQGEVSRAQESKTMVDMPIWRECQSPAITSPLTGKCREAGRARVSRRTEESFAILTSAWLCLTSKVRPRKAYREDSSYVVVLRCRELQGQQSGCFLYGHLYYKKIHVDALQLQRRRLMAHSEAQFKALNTL